MYIAKFQIEDYKSFLSSQELTLVPGFNVIVGQNNVGKTALIEALSLRFESRPHRSMKTIPRPGIARPGRSTVNMAFQLDAGEAEELLINSGNFFFPMTPGSNPVDEAASFLEKVRNPDALKCSYQEGAFVSAYLEAFGERLEGQNSISIIVDNSQRKLISPNSSMHANNNAVPKYGMQLSNVLRDRIYIFRAERLNLSMYNFGIQTVLQPNASNLPEALHNLQSSNSARFNRLNSHVSSIFPAIKWITVPSFSNNQVQILVWSIDQATERADLAIPLSESGTGIGQVLAILYVVLTAEYPRTIIIDEPQSFLHPGAVRKLIETLKQYPQHQFIITTHSPDIVTATNPETLFLLRKPESETIIETMDVSEAKSQRIFLSEIGSRLSDVFGADNILWVEGATEELCFPLIVRMLLEKSLMGTKIIGVIQTGDFEIRHPELIIQIYKRLSNGSGLIPPAIGFIFDREGRSTQIQDDIIRLSQGSVAFLPRRMYENYLLNPQAIAAVVSKIKDFRATPISTEEVEVWLQNNHLERKYYNRSFSEAELAGDKWREIVHGAKLLENFFREFSECRYYYEKTEHGLALTEWIVNNAPNDLTEVAKVIESKLWPAS